MKPVLQALVLAEHVYTDTTGKKIIAGTFNEVLFSLSGPPTTEIELPSGEKRPLIAGGMDGGAPWAYISLTDVCDNTELLLQFVNLSKNKVMFATKVVVRCTNRLATIELVAPLPRLPVKEAGVYAFEVVCEGEIIGSHRVIAKKLVVENEGKEDGNG